MYLHIIPIAISVLPGFLALLLVSGRRAHCWISALIGGGGWLLALLLRTPLLYTIQQLDFAYRVVVASFLAGLFEEVTRSFLLRTGLTRKDVIRCSTSLGLGWGLTEALLIYTAPVVALVLINRVSWVDLLPGAFERNSAIVVHLSLTALLARNPRDYRLLAIAMLLHALVNVIGVLALHYLRNVWITELIIAIVAIAYLIFVAHPSLKYLKQRVNLS